MTKTVWSVFCGWADLTSGSPSRSETTFARKVRLSWPESKSLAPLNATSASAVLPSMMLSNVPPMALVKTIEPATNATPSTIANAESSRRSLRAKRLRQVTRHTSGAFAGRRRLARGALLHLVQQLLAVGAAELVDDLAVGEEDHPIGVRRRHRVVGHHHDGLTAVVHARAEQAQHLRAGLRVEVAG